MNLNDVKLVHVPRKFRMRVGRGIGSGQGKTAGRGFKGQKSRSGSSFNASFIGGQMPLFRRLPKRGFSNALFKVVFDVVNLAELNAFDAGTTIDLAFLIRNGVVTRGAKNLKVLGGGKLEHALTVRAHAFSATALAAITAAGGKAEEIT